MSTSKQSSDAIFDEAFGLLNQKRESLKQIKVFVGFDGFVDEGFRVVSRRWGPGDQYDTVKTIADWSEQLARAAGKSMNAELVPLYEHMGGNGPFLSKGLGELGIATTLVGPLGEPLLPDFEPLRAHASLHSLGPPGRTRALEFQDGKLLLGLTQPMEFVTPECLRQKLPQLPQLLESHAALALVNWTMLPHMTEIFHELLDVLKKTQKPPEHVFFDLADPQKRPPEHLKEALHTLAQFQRYSRVSLGLNFKEAEQVCEVLRLKPPEDNAQSLQLSAQSIREVLNIESVWVHPLRQAACATSDGTAYLPGKYVSHPRYSTGAGDHFNAGVLAGLLAGLTPLHILALALQSSSSYVRTGRVEPFPI